MINCLSKLSGYEVGDKIKLTFKDRGSSVTIRKGVSAYLAGLPHYLEVASVDELNSLWDLYLAGERGCWADGSTQQLTVIIKRRDFEIYFIGHDLRQILEDVELIPERRVWRDDNRTTEWPTVSWLVIHASDDIEKKSSRKLMIDHVNTHNGKGFRPRVISYYTDTSIYSGDVYRSTSIVAYSKALAEGKAMLRDESRKNEEQMNRTLRKCNNFDLFKQGKTPETEMLTDDEMTAIAQ